MNSPRIDMSDRPSTDWYKRRIAELEAARRTQGYIIQNMQADAYKSRIRARVDAERIAKMEARRNVLLKFVVSILEAQQFNYGDATATHLALSGTCDEICAALKAWKEST